MMTKAGRTRGAGRHDDKVRRLAALPLLAGAAPREVAEIAAVADVVRVAPGEVLSIEARRPAHAYIVLCGLVEVRVGGVLLAARGAGEIIGEIAVIQGVADTDAIALTEVDALAISVPAMRSLLASSESMRGALLRQMAGRMREIEAQLVCGAPGS